MSSRCHARAPALLTAALLTIACSGSPAVRPAALPVSTPEPVGRLPAGVEPLHYALTLRIVPRLDRFQGQVDVRLRLDGPRDHLWMHGTALTVTRAELRLPDGRTRPARWQPGRREGIAAVAWPGRVGPGEATLHLEYSAAFDRHLQALYRVDSGGDAYAFTQFESLHARRALPCFDEPRFKTPFDVTLLVERDHRAITNTLETSSTPAEDGLRRVRFAPTEPLPTYLLAFAVGPLDVVDAPPIPPNGVRHAPLPFRGVAARGRGAGLQRALADTPGIVRALEEYFDIPYPYSKLDVIAVPDFAAGAMENAGAITFRESYLLLQPDAPADQPRAMASVMAHELAHHWFGDLVTLRWWDDIWLNESFATWMGTRITDQVFPDYRQGLGLVAGSHHAMGVDALATAPAIRQPIESDDDLHRGFAAIIYQKGARVLAMFERFMGETAFRDGLRAYLRARLHGVATSDDLFTALDAAAGRPVSAPMRTLVTQPGVPLLSVDLACDARGRRVTIAQQRFVLPAGRPVPATTWQLPVCVRFPDTTGATTTVREQCTLLTEARGEIALGPGTCPAWVLPNAGAQGYYRWSLPPALLSALIATGWASLAPAERLSVLNNALARFTAGTLDVAALRPLLERAAADPERLVAVEPLGWWSRIISEELSPAAADRARREAGRLYAPAWRTLGWPSAADRDPEHRLLRRDLASFLGLVVRDEAVRTEGARLGRAYLGTTALDPQAVSPELAGTAVSLYLQAEGGPAVDRVLERALASSDAVVRSRLLAALGWAPEPVLGARVLPLGLDERLRLNEMYTPINVALGRGDLRPAVWQWLEAHLDGLLARNAREARGGAVWMGSRFCRRDDQARVQALFAPRLAEVPGTETQLQAVMESIAVCASEREAQTAGLEAAFRGDASP